jgi:hypothetical protein
MDIDMTKYYTTTHPEWPSWEFPDGPWGWNEDGTSKAPTPSDREAHITWFHDYQEVHEVTPCDEDTEWLERLEAHIAGEVEHYGLDELYAWQQILSMAQDNINLMTEGETNAGNG